MPPLGTGRYWPAKVNFPSVSGPGNRARGGNPQRPTVSIGVAAFEETTDRVDLLLKFADDALYEAKRAGRDRVVAAGPASALPELNFTESAPATSTETI